MHRLISQVLASPLLNSLGSSIIVNCFVLIYHSYLLSYEPAYIRDLVDSVQSRTLHASDIVGISTNADSLVEDHTRHPASY